MDPLNTLRGMDNAQLSLALSAVLFAIGVAGVVFRPAGTLPFSSNTPGVYTITVRETNPQGCSGPLNTIQVTVDPTPAALAITGPRSVCTDAATGLNNVPYTVVGQPGSTWPEASSA